MDAIAPEERASHLESAKELFHRVIDIQELTDGYAFHLPADSDTFTRIAKFISLERLCCPFFGFTLEVEPEGGDAWLKLTGREGVKSFIRGEIAEFLGNRTI
jgi:hypothetical protein